MSLFDVSMAGVSVMVGIPAGRDFHPLTVKSLVGTFNACRDRGLPCQLGMVAGSAVIEWARDEVVDLFLQSDATVLFWIDSDMVWAPEDFLRLVVWTQIRPVVCAAYPAKKDQPTFYINHDKARGLIRDEYGLIDINGVGLGFTAMRREVVEAVASKAARVIDEISGRNMASVFRIDRFNNNRRGEDMAFFADIKAQGYSVSLDPSIELGHIGMKKYTGSLREVLPMA